MRLSWGKEPILLSQPAYLDKTRSGVVLCFTRANTSSPCAVVMEAVGVGWMGGGWGVCDGEVKGGTLAAFVTAFCAPKSSCTVSTTPSINSRCPCFVPVCPREAVRTPRRDKR